MALILYQNGISSMEAGTEFVDLSFYNENFQDLKTNEFYFFPIGGFIEHGTRQIFSADSNGTTVGFKAERASGVSRLIELKECFITLHLKDRTELILNRNESSTEKS